VHEIVAVAGRGVEASHHGVRHRLGRPAWVGALHGCPLPAAAAELPSDVIVTALADEHGWLALFLLGDELKPGARALVEALKRLRLDVSLLSGDREETVQHVAAATGIASARGGAGPEDKRAAIARLQATGAIVAMVGDGINDAPSLAQADVSISLAGAAPLTQWTADIVVLGTDIGRVADAIAGARRTFSVIRQNLAWAFVYNVVAIPLAAAGLLTPLVAALGMSISSLLVVANALRLTRMHTAGRRDISRRAPRRIAPEPVEA
jgi:Cu2+-exporting ATPase